MLVSALSSIPYYQVGASESSDSARWLVLSHQVERYCGLVTVHMIKERLGALQ